MSASVRGYPGNGLIFDIMLTLKLLLVTMAAFAHTFDALFHCSMSTAACHSDMMMSTHAAKIVHLR